MPVHYHDSGAATRGRGGRDGRGDADTVVLLHGGGPGASSWSNFGKTMPVIAKRFRTLMMDLPGYGKSAARPVTGHFFTVAAQTLAALLDAIGVEKVHLIGNSLGGGAALRFALDYPRPRRTARADGARRAHAQRVLRPIRPRASAG